MRGSIMAASAAMCLGACTGERITAPEAMRLVAAWDSSAMTFNAGWWIGVTMAQVNSFENLPVPFRLPVELDDETGTYRALVIERHFTNSPREAAGCHSQDKVGLSLWAESTDRRGLDFLTFWTPAEPGPMGGRFAVPVRDAETQRQEWRCGALRMTAGGAHVFPYEGREIMQSGYRQATMGEFSIRRRGGSSACDFLKAPDELDWYGVTCARQSYDVDVDASLRPDTTGWTAARGAARIRVSGRNVPGAIFVTNCAANSWTREFCPVPPPIDTSGVR